MKQPHDNSVVIEYPSRKRMFLISLGALMFVLAGIWMIQMYVAGEETIVTAVVGVVSILFFGLAFLFSLTHLINRRPTFKYDDEGIEDSSSLIPGGRIRWTEISGMQLYTFKGQSFIGINLIDPEDYLGQQGGVQKSLMRVNKGLVEAHVNIGQQGVSTPLPELYEELKRRWLTATSRQAEG